MTPLPDTVEERAIQCVRRMCPDDADHICEVLGLS